MATDGGTSFLEDDALAYLRERGDEVTFPAGETILKRGEWGAALWVILDGEVEVVLRAPGASDQRLLRLGPGETFGELAILRSAPVSTDIVSITPLKVLRYPAEHLGTALSECEPLRRSLLTRLAHDLHRTAHQALRFYRRNRALVGLHQSATPAGEMIATSARMRAVTSRIQRAASSREPVLVTGEPGTGKLMVARAIHAESRRMGAPLIVVDCRELPAKDAGRLLFGAPPGDGPEPSEDHFGAIHLAHGGTLILRGAEALGRDAQIELTRHLQAEREVDKRPFPDVRLTVTINASTTSRRSGELTEELVDQLPMVIDVPTLADRPRDIVPLAREFLRQADDTRSLELTESAARALVSLKYRHRNVDELRSIVELAVRVIDGNELRAEHIFSGFDSERAIGLDISRFWLVRWLVAGGGLAVVRTVVAVFFTGAAVVCLTMGESLAARTANASVWMLWEPVVFGLFLLVGSLWCTVCPLSAIGRLVQRFTTFERPPPAWILRSGSWLSAAGFVLILWSEEFFHMAAFPPATGVLLIALVASAVVCCVVWQREVWCRHLCPLGRLGVALAPVAPLTVAARRSVCASTCTTHDCYKGNDTEPGCPVFHHPQLVSEAHRCKTCLTCLKSCPHGSTGLYLRPRLRSAWRLTSTESYVVPFALTIFFLAPLLMTAQRGGPLADPWWLTLTCWMTLGVAALLSSTLSPILQKGGRNTAVVAAVACALLVLGWGPLMVYQMGHIPLLASMVVIAEPHTLWAKWVGSEIPVVTIVRVAFIVFASILSATILWNARGVASQHGVTIRHAGWWTLIAACTLYTFGSLFFIVR